MAIKSGFASDSEGSIGDGDTTDSLDDTDHDALVRFGIEEAEPQPEQSTTKRKNSKKRRRSSGSEHPPAQRLVKSQEPVLGQFLPRPEIASAAILITNERAQIISPYSIKKIRKLIPQVCLPRLPVLSKLTEIFSLHRPRDQDVALRRHPPTLQALQLLQRQHLIYLPWWFPRNPRRSIWSSIWGIFSMLQL